MRWGGVGDGSGEDAGREAKAEPAKSAEAATAEKPIFQDGFEYEVKRDEVVKEPAFITQGKWSGIKSQNSAGRGAGYLLAVGIGFRVHGGVSGT